MEFLLVIMYVCCCGISWDPLGGGGGGGGGFSEELMSYAALYNYLNMKVKIGAFLVLDHAVLAYIWHVVVWDVSPCCCCGRAVDSSGTVDLHHDCTCY